MAVPSVRTSALAARLVDEAPTPRERQHLDGCEACREELDGLRAQTEALGSLPDLMPPTGDWDELESRLVGEGLIRVGPMGNRITLQATWTQIAAALVLFLAGTGLGAALGAGTPDPLPRDVARAGSLPVRQASDAEEATRVLEDAERQYLAALMQYRRLSGFEDEGGVNTDPVDRFAALEVLLSASQAAVRQAPADPFLNGVLMSTMAEREATLRQISSSDGDNWF